MLQYVVTLLTTIALAAHGLFGCCWHHGHDAAHECALHVHTDVAEDHTDHHDHDSGDGDSAQDDCDDGDDSNSSHCDHGRCVYVGAAKVMPAASVGIPTAIADLAKPSAISGCSQTKTRPPIRYGDVRAAHEPLFLRLQIWLI